MSAPSSQKVHTNSEEESKKKEEDCEKSVSVKVFGAFLFISRRSLLLAFVVTGGSKLTVEKKVVPTLRVRERE